MKLTTNQLGWAFANLNPERVGHIVESAESLEEALEFLRELPPTTAADVVARINVAGADRIFSSLGNEQIAVWLDAANVDTATRILTRVTTEQAHASVALVKNLRHQKILKRSLTYSANSVGMVVETNVWAISETATSAQVIEKLRSKPHQNSPLFSLNSEDEVVGIIRLERLVADDSRIGLVRDYCDQVRPILVDSPISSVLEEMRNSDSNALPVVDYKGRLQGFVRRADLANAAFGNQPTRTPHMFLDLIASIFKILSQMLTILLTRDHRT